MLIHRLALPLLALFAIGCGGDKAPPASGDSATAGPAGAGSGVALTGA